MAEPEGPGRRPTPLDPSGELRGLADDCVHCGFCLPACPTYQLWGEEMDSPRGRIHLMTQILDGTEGTPASAEHLDRCLGCMACVTACPSGVRYDRLIEAARGWAEEPPLPTRPLRERAARAAIFSVFPYPRRLRMVLAPLRAAQWARIDALLDRSGLAERLSPELASALRLAPDPPPGRGGLLRRAAARPASRSPRGLPKRVPAQLARRAVVGMLTGCVQRVFFPQVNAATANVLAAEGCDVVIPAGQGCCGALSLHGGRRAEAARFARQTIETFERAGVDAVVVNAAGCGSAMKEYAGLLAGDAGWSRRAAARPPPVTRCPSPRPTTTPAISPMPSGSPRSRGNCSPPYPGCAWRTLPTAAPAVDPRASTTWSSRRQPASWAGARRTMSRPPART